MAKSLKKPEAEEPAYKSPYAARYTPDLANEILYEIASGRFINGVCKDPGMPHERSVRLWVINDHDGFAAKYAQACEMRADRLFEETIEIADDGSIDMDMETGKILYENVQRSKLRIDTRKFMISKMVPKKYGPPATIQINGKGEDEGGEGITVKITGGLPTQE